MVQNSFWCNWFDLVNQYAAAIAAQYDVKDGQLVPKKNTDSLARAIKIHRDHS